MSNPENRPNVLVSPFEAVGIVVIPVLVGGAATRILRWRQNRPLDIDKETIKLNDDIAAFEANGGLDAKAK